LIDMLLKLSIENYALIEKLEIEFPDGFSVITGETGAGKSILVGALSLILGERADTNVLSDTSRKCIVEGTVGLSGYGLEEFFSVNDIDYEECTVIRREISPGGKSRAFINDTPVNISILKELAERLVSIHSQHSIITLNDPVFQLAVIDDYSGIQSEVTMYRSRFRQLAETKRELAALSILEKKSRSEEDYNRFLLEELVKANLRDGEQEEMERRQEILAHAGEIKSGLLQSIHRISGEETNILSLLSDAISTLGPLATYHNDLEVIVERLNSNQIDIKDILSDLHRLEPTISFDQDESDLVASRLDLIYRLEKKHLVRSVAELISIRLELESKITDTANLGERISALEATILSDEASLRDMAVRLSKKRSAAAGGFQKEMTGLLVQLGMPFAKFKAGIERTETLTRDGIDRVRFLFSANKGVEVNDLSKVASGGELSRLMLSIKSLITQKNLLPTVIFDEIDSGISGEIAGKVGNILMKMSSHMQVIVITHLPQIAGKGDSHFWVYKKDSRTTTRSMIRKLSDHERVEEIARMLSNEEVSEAAVMTAKELLKN
jgi:DNA repair protein RecN (Recombination protein N)